MRTYTHNKNKRHTRNKCTIPHAYAKHKINISQSYTIQVKHSITHFQAKHIKNILLLVSFAAIA